LTPPATRFQASQKVNQDPKDITPPQGLSHQQDMIEAAEGFEKNTSEGVSRGDQHNLTSDEEGKSPVHLVTY